MPSVSSSRSVVIGLARPKPEGRNAGRIRYSSTANDTAPMTPISTGSRVLAEASNADIIAIALSRLHRRYSIDSRPLGLTGLRTR